MQKLPAAHSGPLGAIGRYGLAIALVSASLALTLLLESTFLNRFWFIFLAAIMIGAWFGGIGPGLAAVVLSILAVNYFLLPPANRFSMSKEDIPFVITFACCALGAAWVSSSLKQAQVSLREARDELEARVEERTAELRRSADALRENERELRLQTEVIAQQIWSALPDGSIEYCNQRLLTYLGCSMEEMRGMGFLRFIHPEDRERVLAAWQQAVTEGSEYDLEARQLGSDGKYRWFLIRGLPLRDADGHVIKWYGTNTDIERRKEAEQELLNFQTELARLSRVLTMGELTTLIAHEVNQPLAAVVTNADAALRWLAADPPNMDKARESLYWIVKEGNRASQVIQRIRNLSKRSPAQKSAVDLNDVVREVVSLIGADLNKNKVSVQLELEPDLPAVAGDRVQLQQVILNLIMNGIEAMSGVTDRSRELKITSHRSGGNAVCVEVIDCGTGLDTELRDRVFDAFVTTKEGGIGMGLSISRTIIEAHGGRLWADANGSLGATFQFTLPVINETTMFPTKGISSTSQQ